MRTPSAPVKERLAERLLDARQRTEELLEPVDDARLCRQHDALMSPLVWDYGHIAVYEELWLVQRLSGREPADPERLHLYDAFEKPRQVRGELPLMSRQEVGRYRREVDERALELLGEADLTGDDPLVRDAFVHEMVVQHEHQHQETILQALQMLPGGYRVPLLTAPDGPAAAPADGAGGAPAGEVTGAGAAMVSAAAAGGASTPPVAGGRSVALAQMGVPGGPAANPAAAGRSVALAQLGVPGGPAGNPGAAPHGDAELVRVAAGRYPIGRDGSAPYDNESPRHHVELAAFDIERWPVTNLRYQAFIADGGYARPELWSTEGWAWRCEAGAEAPKHWRPSAGGWDTERFGTRVPVDPALPVIHVCWYEADAFARWAGRRLPTEREWEVAATWDPATGTARAFPWGDRAPDDRHATVGQRRFGCSPAGSLPESASPAGCEQMIGDVWEWTASHFRPYPGFTAFPYREYSEVFFGTEHRVLRGGSWATRSSVARPTFRNWDLPVRRQIFAGLRCARDAGAR